MSSRGKRSQSPFRQILFASAATSGFILALLLWAYRRAGQWQILALAGLALAMLLIRSRAGFVARRRLQHNLAVRWIAGAQILCTVLLPLFTSEYETASVLMLVIATVELSIVDDIRTIPVFIVCALACGAGAIGLDLVNPAFRLAADVIPPTLGYGICGLLGLDLASSLLLLWETRIKPDSPNHARLDLATQQSLLFTVIAAGSILLVTSVLISQIRTAQIAQVGEGFQTVAEINAERIGNVLEQQINSLLYLGRREPALLEGLAASNAAYPEDEAARLHFLEERIALWQSSAENSDFVMHYRNNPQTKIFRTFRGNDLLYDNLFLTDRFGALVAVQGDKPDTFYYGNALWWKAAWDEGRGDVYVGDLQIEPESHDASIFIAVGVLNPQTNETLGVLAATYYLKAIQRDIAQTQAKVAGELHLLAPERTVIAGPDDDEIGRQIWPGLEAAGILAADASVARFSEAGWRLGIDRHGKAAVLAHAPLNTTSGINIEPLHGLGWKVFNSDTQANALEGMRESVKIASLVGLLSIAAVVMAAIAISTIITRPIEALTKTAAAMGAGDLQLRAEPVGPVEMVTLADAFNTLTLRLRSLINNLQEQVAQRTAQLERAKEEAEAANRAKSLFLANMSHELRTPLNAILGFAQLMARTPDLTADQRENLETINRSGEHLLNLINDVLTMSKIEAGRMVLNENSFDLFKLLESLEDMFLIRAVEKQLALIFERAGDVPQYIHADEGKLRQVLMNLLNNAVRFTEKGHVTLRVSKHGLAAPLSPAEASQDAPPFPLVLRFEVEDSGPGITDDELDALFEPFVQTAIGRASQQGTGLGLPISRQFVHLMGGDLAVSSAGIPGLGSCFRFTIQARLAGLVETDTQSMLHSRRVTGVAPGQPRYRLLVVEDDKANRRLLVKLLVGLGFEVREASNGKEALGLWQAWRPQLIWMDMRMPVMDGYEATRRIKAVVEEETPVIIALTASVFEESRTAILAHGCDDFLRKPFRAVEILEMLTRHLGVHFTYGDGSIAQANEHPGKRAPRAADAVAQVGGETQFITRLAALPQEWLTALEQATMLGDPEWLSALIEQIRAPDPALANALDILAQEYAHDRIAAFIHQVTGNDNGLS
ncbi:MAG: response regulator [Anaerolineae bacterium]|nr:response regulator [Anaerolineae bacterium]